MRAGGGRTLRVADRWFERREVEDGLLLVTEPHVDPFLRANVWLVRGRNRDVLVDSGLGLASLRQALADLLDRPSPRSPRIGTTTTWAACTSSTRSSCIAPTRRP